MCLPCFPHSSLITFPSVYHWTPETFFALKCTVLLLAWSRVLHMHEDPGSVPSLVTSSQLHQVTNRFYLCDSLSIFFIVSIIYNSDGTWTLPALYALATNGLHYNSILWEIQYPLKISEIPKG